MTTLPYPNHLENLRADFVNQVAKILEIQSRTQSCVVNSASLSHNIHQEMCVALEKILTANSLTLNNASNALQKTIDTIKRLDECLQVLFHRSQHQSEETQQSIENIIVNFNDTLQTLSATLIEKNLLERQSQVLEKIILSHERISQWQEFVQEILLDFYSLFPFDFFYIAFAEGNGLTIYLYYLGTYSEKARFEAKSRLKKQMLEGIGLPEDAVLDIQEFHIRCKHLDNQDRSDINMISVSVPDHSPNLAGLLGVAYASKNKLSVQEESVIRSILAVMVMIVGSSKVLSRTLLELEYYSLHDPLTGLYNRRQFNDVLSYEVDRSERHNHEFTVLMLDLDDFKDINDSYGHPTGDSALCSVASVLLEHTRKGDLCARIGGDEFAIILVETDAQGASIVAENISKGLHAMSLLSQDENQRFHLTVSIGTSSYPKDAKTLDNLLAGADVAVYKAKAMGKNSVCAIHSIQERVNIKETRAHVEDLRDALKANQIIPYYQPILNCQTGELFAFETLARLKLPNGETQSAGAFIEVIEKYGLARDLDKAIIGNAFLKKRACIDAQTIEANSKIFINLSVQEIQGRGVLGYAEELCQQLNISPNQIVFELLERDAISDMTNMRRFLNNLRTKGFEFALDDFGSGYNSFHYLRELRFEYVKIDGSFVRNILNSKIDYALVQNLSKLCQDIDILTVAEFVENEQIWQALKEMGINYAQGYHLGMPISEMRHTSF